jgi:glycosyltransferase involved in cell wall biosynthesis
MTALAFLVPGRLDQLTGGYLFDRHVVEGLRARGREVHVIELAGAFPEGDDAACGAVARALDTALPAVIDGLALAGLAGLPAQRWRGPPLIAFVHHPLAAETGLAPAQQRCFAALERALLPRFRGVLCPSRGTAAAVADYGVAGERTAIVPPGTAKPARPPRPREGAVRSLLCVASLTARKGHLLLIEALSRLRHRDWHLVCVGSLDREPATAAAIRRAIAQAGLDTRITLSGERPPAALAPAYAAADAFVLPSHHEGFGMAFAEAMAYGLPVVGTTAGAIPDTVPETAGLLVPPGDPAALTAALDRLMRDPALARSLAVGALRAAQALDDWPRAVVRWEAAFDCLSRLAAPG